MDYTTQRNKVEAFHKAVKRFLPQVINAYGVNYRLNAIKALHGDYSLVYYSFNGKQENRDNKLFARDYHYDRSVEQVIQAYLKEINTIPFTVVEGVCEPFTVNQAPMMRVGKSMKPKDIKIAELQIICTELKNTTETLFNTKAQLLAEIAQLKAENATLKSSYGVSLPEYNRLKLINSELQSANAKLSNEVLQRDGTIREINRKLANVRNTLNQI
jgi:hypothetical protein